MWRPHQRLPDRQAGKKPASTSDLGMRKDKHAKDMRADCWETCCSWLRRHQSTCIRTSLSELKLPPQTGHSTLGRGALGSALKCARSEELWGCVCMPRPCAPRPTAPPRAGTARALEAPLPAAATVRAAVALPPARETAGARFAPAAASSSESDSSSMTCMLALQCNAALVPFAHTAVHNAGPVASAYQFVLDASSGPDHELLKGASISDSGSCKTKGGRQRLFCQAFQELPPQRPGLPLIAAFPCTR